MPYTDLGIDFYQVGEPGSLAQRKYKEVQNYSSILKNYNANNKFTDNDFPADASSVGMKVPEKSTLVWRRPSEITKIFFGGAAPIFMTKNDDSRFDVTQGVLGDCWFLACLADITTQPSLLKILIPDDNAKGFEVGAFHFRFWRRGVWIDVIVDDRLPYWDEAGYYPRNIAMKVVKNEFWCALIEKAYAKLYGSYKYIDAGQPAHALEDLSGGIVEYIVLSEGKDMRQLFRRAFDNCALMAAGSKETKDLLKKQPKVEYPQGLVGSHAYSMLGFKDLLDSNGKSHFLIRLRNPWGSDIEWAGKWSDGDDKSWASVKEDLRHGSLEKDGKLTRADGEFWIEYEDFIKTFDTVQICHWSIDYHGDKSIQCDEKHPYTIFVENSHWQSHASRNITSKKSQLASLPGYKIYLERRGQLADATYTRDDPTRCVILVNLMYTRVVGLLPFYRAPGKFEKLDKTFFRKAHDVATGGKDPYKNATIIKEVREFTNRQELPPGTCFLIPFVEYSDENINSKVPYLIRIICEGGSVVPINQSG